MRFLKPLIVGLLIALVYGVAANAQEVSGSGDDWVLVTPGDGDLLLGTQGTGTVRIITNQGGTASEVVLNSGGLTVDDVVLPNDGYIQGQSLAGAAHNLIGVDTNADIIVGSANVALDDILYIAQDDHIFRSGGTTVATFDSGGLTMETGTFIRGRPGSSSFPAYSFTDDTDTGIYRVGSNQMGFASIGTLQMSVNNGTVVMSPGGSTVATFDSGGLILADGSATEPSLAWTSDTDTGLAWDSSGETLFVGNGSLIAYVGTGGFGTTGEIRNVTTGGALVLRSPDGSYSVCTVDNSDVLSCAAE